MSDELNHLREDERAILAKTCNDADWNDVKLFASRLNECRSQLQVEQDNCGKLEAKLAAAEVAAATKVSKDEEVELLKAQIKAMHVIYQRDDLVAKAVELQVQSNQYIKQVKEREAKFAAIENRAEAAESREAALREALKHIWLYAVHGTGTKQKDARGRQFAAITAEVEKAYPDVADAALAPESTAQSEGGK